MSNRETFIQLCQTNIKRKGIDKLLEALDKSDFFTAPASTKYHDSVEGGLCYHSLRVYTELLKLVDLYQLSVSDETLTIISLFHDLCKVNCYQKYRASVKNEFGKWVEVDQYKVDELYPYGEHADKSIIILQQYIKLTEEEIYAIRAHMGGFDVSVKGGSSLVGRIFDKSFLAVLLHCADLIATKAPLEIA